MAEDDAVSGVVEALTGGSGTGGDDGCVGATSGGVGGMAGAAGFRDLDEVDALDGDLPEFFEDRETLAGDEPVVVEGGLGGTGADARPGFKNAPSATGRDRDLDLPFLPPESEDDAAAAMAAPEAFENVPAGEVVGDVAGDASGEMYPLKSAELSLSFELGPPGRSALMLTGVLLVCPIGR